MPPTERCSTVVPTESLLTLIRAEYREMPDLELTVRQAQRLWRLDDATSTALFKTLLDIRFLRRTPRGAYVRAAA
jgi:hypothetical protein